LSVAAQHYAALSRRSITNTLRRPTAVVPSILFPLLFMAMTASALNKAISLPGFPAVDGFVQFSVAATIVQGVLFGAVSAGSDMATDIEDGFFERLMASPVSRTSIVIGRLAGAALLGFFQGVFFLTVVSFFTDIEGGVQAVLLIGVVAAALAAGIGAFSVAIGLKTGSSEAVQGTFPLLFASLFLSSAFFPRDLMSGWFKSVATVNPISHLIEGMRHQIITGVSIEEWAVSLGIALVVLAVGVTVSLQALRGRLRLAHH
jgi:ABC-2 type transport system permease protein